MVELDDETLVRRSAQGDERAFIKLVRRYEQPLVTSIRYQIDNLDHAEDVLQETLLHAWNGLGRLREPKKVGAWLLQIARNQCRDFNKSSQRRDFPTEEQELKEIVNRFGYTLVRQKKIADEVVEALEEVPAAEREVAKLFYLEGLTIDEIAARRRCPEGTVKRRLFDARNHMRQTLEISNKERRISMNVRKQGAKDQPFPIRRPEIVITEIKEKPFSVDCPELRCWCIVPEVGQKALFAIYDPPDWKLSEVYEMYAVRQAEIHEVEGVEIEVNHWKRETGWAPLTKTTKTIYGRLTEEKAQYLAVRRLDDNKSILWTFLDKGFDEDWGEINRKLKDRGRFALQKDGSFKQPHSFSDLEAGIEASGAGIFSVKIGERSFVCLRGLEVGGAIREDIHTHITESYLTQTGRTVLVRRYCHNCSADTSVVDKSTQIVIDGVTFDHWYDALSNLALGFS